MKEYLSYILDSNAPVWPGEPNIEITHCTQIKGECKYNSFLSKLPNHCGTHYDGPWHFNPKGVKFTELPIDYFWFEDIAVVDAPKKPGEGVVPGDLTPYEKEISKAKLLLIKTGFSYVRSEEPEVYRSNGPYLTPSVAKYLVETFPNLNTVGFDFLSIGSPANTLSAQTHQILLGCQSDHFVTGIEDMNLRPLYENSARLKRVIAAPLRIAGVDSSQVCVMAEFE
ncbi:MAG: cyclase family protein [Lachnospiraceae bacterium]|nr:cyclase family protein [Lachnospiraceae bacterium]MBR4994409.1 cyclase family protein [Lachnospiraceae bacterium]MBR5943486.1 cyclase family protein [Lachnospiraceae bacterium]